MKHSVESRFAVNPTRIDMSRSRFDRNSTVKLSCNVGDLVPFYVDEVLPGDTFDVKTSKVVRLQTLLTPMMDNLYADFYWFFVPNRIVWDHWRELNGENTQSAWIPEVEYQVPQVTSPASTGWNIGTIADYMGIPTGVSGLSVNALPFRAYALICNEWFRDENLTDPLNIPTGDATQTGVNTGNYISDVANGGLPFKVAKYHDFFTSCLPAPQKGVDVTLQTAQLGNAPVVPLPEAVPTSLFNTAYNVYIKDAQSNSDSKGPGYYPAGWDQNAFTGVWNTGANVEPSETLQTSTPSFLAEAYPGNLWAMFDNTVSVATINQLRMAFQVQKLYERDARGGTRYVEILKSHFGVTSPDARLQRPEYLGGSRVPLTVQQVVQNSSSVESMPLGDTAGMSLTVDTHKDFRKSFVEHGFVVGLMCVRYQHTYQQGLERMWSRKDRFDYYWPVFANIGEQAVLNKEIYAQGTAEDDEVFGYQEAWADYRYKPNRVCGEMRSSAPQSLDVWHLADDYASLPALSDSWIREDGKTVDRVLAVTSDVSNQLFADIFIRNRTTRPMPVYSIPGLIDHH